MGTKSNPGPFDCYAKAADDEPLFTLRAKDPSAPYLVLLWKACRNRDFLGMSDAFRQLVGDKQVQALASSDVYEKLKEADQCAEDMRTWRKANVPDVALPDVGEEHY